MKISIMGLGYVGAVAAGFTLQVVEPHLNGPLGEAPILVYSAKHRRAEMICGQGVAPAAAVAGPGAAAAGRRCSRRPTSSRSSPRRP